MKDKNEDMIRGPNNFNYKNSIIKKQQQYVQKVQKCR